MLSDKQKLENAKAHVRLLITGMLDSVIDQFPKAKESGAWDKLSDAEKKQSKEMMFEIVYGKPVKEFATDLLKKIMNSKSIE